jgi:hypothetical protein
MSRAELRTAEIGDTFRAIFAREYGCCEVCGLSANRYGTAQLAHRIPQGKRWLRKYGAEVIHSPLNMALTCSLKCNGAVDIRNHPIEIAALVAKIKGDAN